jgi:hypothetical protein
VHCGGLMPWRGDTQHLDVSPLEYIQWRFAYGEDREGLEKVTRKVRPPSSHGNLLHEHCVLTSCMAITERIGMCNLLCQHNHVSAVVHLIFLPSDVPVQPHLSPVYFHTLPSFDRFPGPKLTIGCA